MVLSQLLRTTLSCADAPALSWYRDGKFEARYSYRDLCKRVQMAAHMMSNLKVRRGDRVLVLSNNSPEMYCLLLSIMSLGAIAAPLNPLEPAHVLKQVMLSLEPAIVVVDDETLLMAGVGDVTCPWMHIRQLFVDSVHEPLDRGFTGVSSGDTAVILSTSGTTSTPKGVCLSHANLMANAMGLHRTHRLAENPVHLCVLPLFHANAFGFSMVTSLFARSHVVLCNGLPGFAVWSIIEREAVNIVSVAPHMLKLLCARRPTRPPPDTLRYFVSAAAPLSKKLASQFILATGVKIHQGYGLSECVNFATTIPADVTDALYQEVMFAERVPSIGTPVEGCDVSVRNLDDGTPAASGVEGEIVVTGETLMAGYWKNSEATRGAIPDGALLTGDLGFYRVKDGRRFFYITGRLKEIVIRCGENISPLSVESDLHLLHSFGKFAVAGFENAVVGEEVGLYIEAMRHVDAREVRSILEDCAPRYRPRLVMIGRQAIPATVTGKVKRDVLARRFAAFADRNFGMEPLIVHDSAENAEGTYQ